MSFVTQWSKPTSFSLNTLNSYIQVPIVVVEIKNGSYKMAQTISNISELSTSNVNVLSYAKEVEKMNKVKYNLSLVYFAALTVLLATLFI